VYARGSIPAPAYIQDTFDRHHESASKMVSALSACRSLRFLDFCTFPPT
jgi:hypothetical protein